MWHLEDLRNAILAGRVPMKTCSTCGDLLPLTSFHARRGYVRAGVRAACRSCTALRVRELRKPGVSRTEEERLKVRVRARTRRALQAGQLKRGPCAVCGMDLVEAHHPDYSAPDAHLRVVWLCKEHHASWHTRQLSLFLP